MDLFSVVLSSAASWATKRVLDAAAECVCGTSRGNSIPNQAVTQLTCPQCRNGISQFTNATNHTVNRNGSVAAAHISHANWERWGGLWNFKPHFRVDAVNSKYEDLVLLISLSRFGGEQFFKDQMILKPKWERTSWSDCSWSIDPCKFPKGKNTFAMDLVVMNMWGDKLNSVRQLGEYDS